MLTKSGDLPASSALRECLRWRCGTEGKKGKRGKENGQSCFLLATVWKSSLFTTTRISFKFQVPGFKSNQKTKSSKSNLLAPNLQLGTSNLKLSYSLRKLGHCLPVGWCQEFSRERRLRVTCCLVP